MISSILIVGFGSIGKRHVEIISKNFSNIDIFVLRRKKCKQENLKLLGINQCVTSIKDAISLNPEAAIIAGPSSYHIEVGMQLAKSGIHLLIEKPISNSSKGVNKLIDYCSNNGIVMASAYNLRFHPLLIEFKKNIQNDFIGRIFTVNLKVGSHLPDWRPNQDYSKTVSAKTSLGGGVLLELSHEIDYLLWIFGKILWVKTHVSKQSNLLIDCEDLANIIFGLQSSNGDQYPATLNMDFFRHDSIRECEVIGENGSLVLNLISGELKFFSSAKRAWEVLYSSLPNKNYTYLEEIKNFIDLIDTKVFSSNESALNVVLAIEAIKKSSNINKVVYL